jgi:hypothetical protein
MSDVGLFIASANTTVSDNELDFDSRRKHLLVDLDASPRHFDIVNLTGTNISTPDGSYREEILLTIPHHLPYTPKVETYIFVSGNFNLYAGSGSYYRTYYPYSGSSPTSDLVIGSADATNYYIKHTLVSPGAYTSNAASFPLQIKYYIFSNRGSF